MQAAKREHGDAPPSSPVHARELADVREGVLQAVRKLEGVDVAEPVLHVRVDDELRQAQDLARQVEGVAEARLLALLGRQAAGGEGRVQCRVPRAPDEGALTS